MVCVLVRDFSDGCNMRSTAFAYACTSVVGGSKGASLDPLTSCLVRTHAGAREPARHIGGAGRAVNRRHAGDSSNIVRIACACHPSRETKRQGRLAHMHSSSQRDTLERIYRLFGHNHPKMRRSASAADGEELGLPRPCKRERPSTCSDLGHKRCGRRRCAAAS